jgi:hypothetical protein
MQAIKTAADMKIAIRELEYRQLTEWTLLKEEVNNTCESLKPSNLIKDTFRELTSSPDFKENILGATAGIAAGGLSRALLVGGTHNPFKKLLGALLQLGVTSLVSKNPEKVKWLLDNLITFFSRKKEANT